MKRVIWFDMDGTIANLYGVDNWLTKLRAEDASPYRQAEPLINMSWLARKLNSLQQAEFEIGIISWLSKTSSPSYDQKVTRAKQFWIEKHLPSVKWNYIHIIPYGTPKQNFIQNENDILFDDEERNRENWTGIAYPETAIKTILTEIRRG